MAEAQPQQRTALSQTTLLSATTGKLDVYVLPLWQKKLLIPALAIAEIISASQLKPTKKNKTAGLLGQVTWEGETLPVISFETFNGETGIPEPQKLAIVVAATLGENLTHYALALQAEPTLNKIKIAELEDLDNAAVGGVEYLQVKYQNNLCFIPELDILETKL
ncbi:MAG TPA: chemotaxis protein CheW, partial [Agitococcus sp.]|nr:chemotaxis protein CheW [Agitococcus sp.]